MKKPTRLSASRAKRPVRVVPASSPAAELPYAPGREARAIVRADLYSAVAPFQSTDKETRRYMCGVKVEGDPTGAIMVATDGKALAAIRDDSGHQSGVPMVWTLDWQRGMPLWLRNWALKRPGKHQLQNAYLDLVRDAEFPYGRARFVIAPDARHVLEGLFNQKFGKTEVKFSWLGTPEFPVAIDNQMLEWRRVVPTEKSLSDTTKPRPVYDARLLNKLLQFVSTFHGYRLLDHSDPAPITITGTAHCPCLVRPTCSDDAFAIVMPMTGVDEREIRAGVPDWASLAPPERTQLCGPAAEPAAEAQAEAA